MTAVTQAEARALAQQFTQGLDINQRHDIPLDALNTQTTEDLDDIAATPAMNAIRRIHPADLSPGVVKHLLAVLSNRVRASGWKHQPRAVAAVEFLDFAIAELEG